MRETRNLLNLHWLFCLRISAKSWTTFCRDRIAPTCTIRHPVWPIVALQRRIRISARLAGFCRSRWHQRRARRAERTSFSVFVSNLDFRVPRLRPIGERALTGPCGGGREAARKAQNRDLGYRSVAGLVPWVFDYYTKLDFSPAHKGQVLVSPERHASALSLPYGDPCFKLVRRHYIPIRRIVEEDLNVWR